MNAPASHPVEPLTLPMLRRKPLALALVNEDLQDLDVVRAQRKRDAAQKHASAPPPPPATKAAPQTVEALQAERRADIQRRLGIKQWYAWF